MRELKKFAEESIDMAREVGIEKRSQARQARMSEIQARQAGETQRTQMALTSREKEGQLDRDAAIAARGPKTGKSDKISGMQMAQHRESAWKRSQEQLDARRDYQGNIINPVTQKPMTRAEEAEYVKVVADQMLDFSLSRSPEGEEPQGAGSFAKVTRPEMQSLDTGGGDVAPPVAQPGVAPVAQPGVAPGAAVVTPAVSQAQRRGAVAAKLRSQYEKERQAETPSLSATIGRGASAIGRGASRIIKRVTQTPGAAPPATPPGLRGYMQNAYNR